MSEQPDSIGTGGSISPSKIEHWQATDIYQPGAIVMGTDGNLWRHMVCISDGSLTYWQRMQVLNVETMQLEGEA